MEKTLARNSRTWGQVPHVTLGRGMGWGLLGGLAGTMVMDLVLMAAFSVAKLPVFTCFSIIGETVARFFSIPAREAANVVPLGVAAHYLIGPLVGAVFGVLVARFDALRIDTLKRAIALAVLYVEILSQPILVTTPILLQMTTPETLLWFGGSFVMHLILGVVLGVVVSSARGGKKH